MCQMQGESPAAVGQTAYRLRTNQVGRPFVSGAWTTDA